jgi:hypothetical protein
MVKQITKTMFYIDIKIMVGGLIFYSIRNQQFLIPT